MISYQEAVERILREVAPLAARRVPLAAAAGRVTAVPLHAGIDVPGFDNAAVDGFAVAAADTASAGPDTTLAMPVAGTLVAGCAPPGGNAPGAAWEIMTGAPMPPGCDAVIPIERTEWLQGAPQRVRVSAPVSPGDNVRRTAEDFRAGALVVDAGTVLEPHILMALAATGCDGAQVRPAPRVAILTTGNELTGDGIPARPGTIRDANGPYLRALLAELGNDSAGSARVADTLPELRAALVGHESTADVILTTGGVSAGRMDLVPAAIAALGGTIIFHKVAIRPGKPLLFARLPSGPFVFGLPGNPMAVAVGLRFFVIPALRRLQGMVREEFPLAVCPDPIRSRGDLRFFGKARAHIDAQSRLVVRLLRGQESFKISGLVAANCWAIVPEGSDRQAGDQLQIAPLRPGSFSL